jgi:hypothetical protein
VNGDIHAQVAGREGELLGLLGIDPGPSRGARHRPCPFPDHDDAHPSWRWDAEKRRWFCTCAEKGGNRPRRRDEDEGARLHGRHGLGA